MEGVLFVLKKVKMTATNIIASFLLMGIERLLELGYRCPGSAEMRKTYISVFFILPFVSIILLGYLFQTRVFKMSAEEHKQRFCIFLRSLVPACIWIVILLLDGKYSECFFFSEAENCPKDNPCDSAASAISKICGMALLLFVILGSCIYIYFSRKTISSDESTDPATYPLGHSADPHDRSGGVHSAIELENVA